MHRSGLPPCRLTPRTRLNRSKGHRTKDNWQQHPGAKTARSADRRAHTEGQSFQRDQQILALCPERNQLNVVNVGAKPIAPK